MKLESKTNNAESIFFGAVNIYMDLSWKWKLLLDWLQENDCQKEGLFPFARQQKRFFPHQKLQFLRNNIKQIRKSEQKKPSSIINQQWWAEEQHWGQWDGTWVQNIPLLETSERWGIVFKTSRFTSLSSCTCKWDWFGEDRILFQDQQ